jgi:single-strand DNA-binding protein
MAGDINRVIITGRLTKDPDHRTFPEKNSSVCSLRVAVNGRRRNPDTNQWEDQANFFDVTVWGQQGDNCARYLSKGRQIAVDGRLRHRTWETDGQTRSAVDIIADSVQFLGGGRDGAGETNGSAASDNVSTAPPEGDVPIDSSDFEPSPVAAGAADEDIPF